MLDCLDTQLVPPVLFEALAALPRVLDSSHRRGDFRSKPLNGPKVAAVPSQRPSLVVKVVPPHLLPARLLVPRSPGRQEVARSFTTQAIAPCSLVVPYVREIRRPDASPSMARPRIRQNRKPTRLKIQEERNVRANQKVAERLCVRMRDAWIAAVSAWIEFHRTPSPRRNGPKNERLRLRTPAGATPPPLSSACVLGSSYQ